MKKYLVSILFLVVGILIGVSSVWYVSYLPAENRQESFISFTSLLSYSNISISDSNFLCEEAVGKTVSAIVGYMLEYNQRYSRNRLSYQCNNNLCELSVSNCTPWKFNECGATILEFTLDSEKKIKTDSFMCINVP